MIWWYITIRHIILITNIISPEDSLFYVRDVDLSQDFDEIWFLDTDFEWDFVPDQILPYNLQIEYVGHYGIEHNEFDLYRVTKGITE